MQTKARGRPRQFAAPDSRIPNKAPELWRGVRAADETLEAFFRRVWKPHLKHGLQSVQLRRLDPDLWKALYQHIVRYALPWPDELTIPNLKPRPSAAIAKLDAGRWHELSDDEIIDALIKRRRERVKEELKALRARKRELRGEQDKLKKELRTASRRKGR